MNSFELHPDFSLMNDILLMLNPTSRCNNEEKDDFGKRRRIQARAMSSSEEETSLIKTPRPSDENQSSSEKAKAERLRRQKELQAAFKERMREKGSEKRKEKSEEEASQIVLGNSPREHKPVIHFFTTPSPNFNIYAKLINKP